jgi:hypothetical protein
MLGMMENYPGQVLLLLAFADITIEKQHSFFCSHKLRMMIGVEFVNVACLLRLNDRVALFFIQIPVAIYAGSILHMTQAEQCVTSLMLNMTGSARWRSRLIASRVVHGRFMAPEARLVSRSMHEFLEKSYRFLMVATLPMTQLALFGNEGMSRGYRPLAVDFAIDASLAFQGKCSQQNGGSTDSNPQPEPEAPFTESGRAMNIARFVTSTQGLGSPVSHVFIPLAIAKRHDGMNRSENDYQG